MVKNLSSSMIILLQLTQYVYCSDAPPMPSLANNSDQKSLAVEHQKETPKLNNAHCTDNPRNIDCACQSAMGCGICLFFGAVITAVALSNKNSEGVGNHQSNALSHACMEKLNHTVEGMRWDLDYLNARERANMTHSSCLCPVNGVNTTVQLYSYAQDVNPNATSVCIRPAMQNCSMQNCTTIKPLSRSRRDFKQLFQSSRRKNHQLKQPRR